MAKKTPPIDNKPKSTLEWLMGRIDAYLKLNPDVTEAAFGWSAIKDTGLVPRLRSGGDVTTRKFDALVRYMSNPNQKDSDHGKQSESEKGRQKA